MAQPASNADGQAVPVISVSAGQFVFRTGDAANSLFIISTGQIELLRRGETHGRLALLGPGDLCGEDTAFEGQVRAYDARALTSALLLQITTATFADLVRAHPEVAGAVINCLAIRLLQARAACLTMALPVKAGRNGTQPRFLHVESGSQFPLPATAEAVVGRADPVRKFQPDIELSSIDEHRSLSRRHAIVKHVENAYQIVEGPGVVNGTFVNGVRLSPGVAVPIQDGDEVSFGSIRTVFRTT